MTEGFWSAGRDMRLRRMMAEGRAWDEIADDLGASEEESERRGLELGAARRPPRPRSAAGDDRVALPPGHRRSWGPLTGSTLLHGRPYPLPVFPPNVV